MLPAHWDQNAKALFAHNPYHPDYGSGSRSLPCLPKPFPIQATALNFWAATVRLKSGRFAARVAFESLRRRLRSVRSIADEIRAWSRGGEDSDSHARPDG